MLAILLVLTLGNTLSVVVATKSVNSETFSCFVSSTKPYVSSALYKSTNGAACVKIEVRSGALCYWVNNYTGMRVTNKMYFSSPGTFSLSISGPMDLDHLGIYQSVILVISPQFFEFSPIYVSGTWSPDTF